MKLFAMLIKIVDIFLRLIKIEGKLLKKKIMNFVWALAFTAVSTLLVLAAAGFFLLGTYQYFAAQMPPAAASIFVSVLALILALIFACLAKWRTS